MPCSAHAQHRPRTSPDPKPCLPLCVRHRPSPLPSPSLPGARWLCCRLPHAGGRSGVATAGATALKNGPVRGAPGIALRPSFLTPLLAAGPRPLVKLPCLPEAPVALTRLSLCPFQLEAPLAGTGRCSLRCLQAAAQRRPRGGRVIAAKKGDKPRWACTRRATMRESRSDDTYTWEWQLAMSAQRLDAHARCAQSSPQGWGCGVRGEQGGVGQLRQRQSGTPCGRWPSQASAA